ncbi:MULTISPECIES: acetate/propionate family kinase [Sphingomonadaceae]|jgi:acetate kinase|uniref:Acetate kinase n=2 Tax=Sphingomonadales TaxID=204457 RepID=A0A239K8F2_9SPHN|nr:MULTISPECIES: acetate/propionate family kinase [Sphingomonadaceae]SMP82423.1 acetate kinase [Novosphingobium panipatense]SNT14240.1 acetate kinase [Sphingomonas laterariae]
MKAIVSLNSGSSSIKFAFFTLDGAGHPERSAGGKIEKIGIAPSLVARRVDGTVLVERTWEQGADLTHAELLKDLFDWAIEHLEGREVIAIGHRVVHGGMRFAAPRRVDAALLTELDALCPLAPLHQPHNLAAIRAIAALAPDLPQIACFDTAFHHDKPEVAARLALPRALHEQGIRRYGFHGLSYEYIAGQLRTIDGELAGGRVIAAHLGNGASLCAMRDGKSVDTTMGFTALDGLMMGTRCGTLDPGVVLHLQTQMGLSPAGIDDLLYRKSGLLGVSGISSDMRILTADPSRQSQEAVELFIWRAVREFGALTASLGGVDGIVFTAGIGENHAEIRRRICERFDWLGLSIDDDANAANALCISGGDSRVKVLVIPTDEERMIADHTLAVLRSGS